MYGESSENGGRVLSHVAMERDLVQEEYPLRPLGVEHNVMVKQPKRNHAKNVNVQVRKVLLPSICIIIILIQFVSICIVPNRIPNFS